MAKVGLLTFSDGRDFVQRDIGSFTTESQAKVEAALFRAGHEVIAAEQIVTSNDVAVAQARLTAAHRPDVTVFNYPVWAFPHFTMLAADATAGPIVLFSNIDPTYPGMVGMLAAGGGLDQVGRRHLRAWGDVQDPDVVGRLATLIAAAAASSSLRGTTFGRIGGRPMGMYTAVADTDQWMEKFGIDVEEIDQWELVRRTEQVSQSRKEAGRRWLEKHAAGVHYDGARLTPEILERQVGSYHAMRELIDEHHLDFSGIKGQPELTNHFATMDIAEAFLNDPYDWEGPKPPHVCATEADMDGALTMQILKALSGTPVLFADVRHYHHDRGIWDLCNSGQHATWYAARSEDPAENMARVDLLPEIFYFPAGGASVRHVAAPGQCTLARLTRAGGRYRMHVALGAFESYGAEANEALMRQSTPEWPHAFTRMEVDHAEFLKRFGANHIHAVPGDYVDQLAVVCELLEVDFEPLGAANRPAGGRVDRSGGAQSAGTLR